MKRFILGMIVGILLCSGIVYGINIYKAEEISYIPIDTSWEVDNVEDALNDLNEKFNLGDAEPSDIANGKTTVVNGKLITGTAEIIRKISVSWSISAKGHSSDSTGTISSIIIGGQTVYGSVRSENHNTSGTVVIDGISVPWSISAQGHSSDGTITITALKIGETTVYGNVRSANINQTGTFEYQY